MSSKPAEKYTKNLSVDDFEFLDCDGDLDIDWPKSPKNEGTEKLTSGVSAVISTLLLIAEEQGFTVAAPMQAVAATAVGAVTGSLLAGPPGLALGLLTGAVIAYRTSPRKQKKPINQTQKSAIREVFSQLTFSQKRELVKELLGCFKKSNVRSLVYELIKNEGIRHMAMEIISKYLNRKMGIGLVRNAK